MERVPKPGTVFYNPVSGEELVVHSYVVDEATFQIRVSLLPSSWQEGVFLGCTIDDWEKRKQQLFLQTHETPESTCEMPKKTPFGDTTKAENTWSEAPNGTWSIRHNRVVYYDTTGKYNFCWARRIESWNNPEDVQKRFTNVD
jgi:hypothetical protein